MARNDNAGEDEGEGGGRMNHDDWMEETRACPKCGWAGTGRETTMGDSFNDGSERHCPKCFHYFGYVAYPPHQ
jgi:hypothetical protein